MISYEKSEEPIENNVTLAEVVESEEDKKILEPVYKPGVKKKNKPFKIGVVISDTADLKEEPEKYAELITILKKGDAAVIDDDSDPEYYKVTASIKVGYILKSQLEVK